jgi:hypothetical protein
MNDRKLDTFRRITGLLLGAGLALTYGLVTESLVHLMLPGISLNQPPFGAAGNVAAWIIAGALVGLASAWLAESLYGIIEGSLTGAVLISAMTFFSGQTMESSLWGILVGLLALFLPIAASLGLLVSFLRWGINQLVDVQQGKKRVLTALILPVLLWLAVGVIGLFSMPSTRSRQDLTAMQNLIQSGLLVQDPALLPQPLQARRVGSFIDFAIPKYTLEWDNQNVNHYSIPLPTSDVPLEEAVVIARFQNDWVLVCLFTVVQPEPVCRGIGGEAGRIFLTRIIPHPFDVDWEDRSLFQQGMISSAQEIVQEQHGETVYHIDLQIPANSLVLHGSQQVAYTNRENQPLSEVYFRLFPNLFGGKMSIVDVFVNGVGAQVAYEAQDSAVRVPLAKALAPEERVIIEMNFTLEVPGEAGGGYGLLGFQDDILMLDSFYPQIPVYDAQGWYMGLPSPDGDTSVLDSSYYLVRVTVPPGFKLVATGSMIGYERSELNQVMTFAAGPSRDFYLAASDRFIVTSETVRETVVLSYALPEVTTDAYWAQRFAADSLNHYNDRFGFYPYKELEVVSLPIKAGGIEYPGVIGISQNYYHPGGQDAEQSNSFRIVIAHEVAHQWFYNQVGNDQQNEPWLDESLAQYAVWLYYRDIYGDGTATAGLTNYWTSCWQSLEKPDLPIGLPAAEYASSREYVGAVYCRGPLFMQALEETMGSQNLDAFLRQYVASYSWQIVTGADFRQMAEETCHCDLSQIFETWVYGN